MSTIGAVADALETTLENISGLKVFREGRTQGGKTYMFKFGGKKKKISSDDQSAIIDYILGIHKQNLSKSKLKYGGDLIAAADIWHNGMKSDKVTVAPLKERLWKILGDGLYKSIDVFKTYQTDFNGMDFKVKELQRLYDNYFSKKAEGRIKDYIPTQVLDIAPTISKFSRDIHSGFLDKSDVEGRKC